MAPGGSVAGHSEQFRDYAYPALIKLAGAPSSSQGSLVETRSVPEAVLNEGARVEGNGFGRIVLPFVTTEATTWASG